MANCPILVCISSHPKTAVLLRAAVNKAKELGVGWQALYVESADHYAADRETRERILRFISLAEEMGGEVNQVEHDNVRSAIADYVKSSLKGDSPIRHLIVGHTEQEGIFSTLQSSMAERVAHDLRRHCEVQIIPLSGKYYSPTWLERLQMPEVRIQEILFAVAAVGMAYLCAEGLRASMPTALFKVNSYNISLLFLVACVVVSIRFGLLPGLVSAVLSFTVINYYYIMPFRQFSLNDISDAINVSIFLCSALVISLLGAHNRAGRNALARKERRSKALYNIHRVASQATTREEALQALHEALTSLLEMEVAFFLPPALNPDAIQLSYPKTAHLTESDTQSLQTCWYQIKTTGLGTPNRFGSQWRFEPLTTTGGDIGVLGVHIPAEMRLDASFGRLLSALADQAASILERIELTKMMSESRVREEREKLRSMLLSSVSHDLKTPLASIIGSLGIYRGGFASGKFSREQAEELLETALDEAQRLDSFITNILDMTRLESGAIEFRQEWQYPDELVQRVKKRLRQRLRHHRLVVREAAQQVEVRMDVMMTEQVLQNVIDNAAKYSPENTTVTVTAGAEAGGFAYKVKDEGGGIPADKLTAIFDKYERLNKADSKVAGTGLGLAICRTVMEAQGGYIRVRNHEEGGAEFTIWLPECRKMEVPEETAEETV